MGEDLQLCPNCQKSVSRSNFTVHHVHCQRNITTCSLCHEPVPRSQYQQHVETAHSSIRCQRCGNHIEAANLFNHQNEACSRRLIACKYCELEVAAEELLRHLEFCGARTDRCKGCTKYVQFKYLQFHYEHDHKYLNPDEKAKAEVEGKEGEDGEECPVCLGPVTLPLTLECGHMFCMVCVKGIANTTKNCAICRRDIQRDMLMDIRFCREEDIIKNYVNNPKYKKTTRSRSVPSRRVGVTTEDYDNMVSALLSSRTSPSNCRYQRPNNGHTPPDYTPYCFLPTNTTNTSTESTNTSAARTTTTSSLSYLDSYKDDDCCCSSLKEGTTTNSTSSTPNPNTRNPPSKPAPPSSTSKSTAPIPSTTKSSSISSSTNTSAAPSSKNCSSSPPLKCSQSQPSATKSDTTSESSKDSPAPPRRTRDTSDGRPRRPTSLALQGDDKKSQHPSNESNASERSQPQHLSQEEYDRWLAFQLAQAEDEMSSSEFSKTQRSPFRRSRSMPERNDDSLEFSNPVDRSSFAPPVVQSQNIKSETVQQNGLPPASPRCTSTTPVSTGGSSIQSNSATRGSSLTKSSSDSSANGNSTSSTGNTVMSTGARPKSSSGLKKRVSFKEDTPPVRRKAPVMLPCEFCDEMFPERDLMRHQTSCDQNETKNPREYLLSRRSSATSPVTSPTSPLSPTPNGFNPSLNIAPLSRPPLAAPSSYGRTSESPSRSNIQMKSFRTPPQSPSPRPRPSHSPISPPRSPSSSNSPQPVSLLSEAYYSPFNSRHASISPGPSVSTSSCSSGVSSGSSTNSSSSVSTTPSTSSSASPIPASIQPSTPGTPTDTEVDFEDDQAFSRPRKGRLLSSAITSWRSISGSKPKDRQKYARSHTAPLEPTVDEPPHSSEISTSQSSSYLRSVPSPASTTEKNEENHEAFQEVTPSVFIKNKNKYPAPPPPQTTRNELPTTTFETPYISRQRLRSPVSPKRSHEEQQSNKLQMKYPVTTSGERNKPGMFKFDSIPLMNGKPSSRDIPSPRIHCEFCKQIFSSEKFRAHQAMCEASKENSVERNHSKSEESKQEGREPKLIIPARRNKGPAPQPPSEVDVPTRKPVERSHSVRESCSESRFSKEFESSGRRLERASSIKETTRFTSRPVCESPPRKWLSREGFYGSSLDCSAAYQSGDGSLTSSATSLNNYGTGSGWLSHISMIREEARSRRSSYAYTGSSATTTPFFGALRYRDRSSSRSRPSSLYASRNAFNIIADAFAAAADKPEEMAVQTKRRAPEPPFKKDKRKFKLKTLTKLRNYVRSKFY